MLETVGYRKADKVWLVIPHDGRTVPQGTIIFDYTEGSQWRVVAESEALSLGAKWVYIETTILPTDLPAGDYRQVGVFSGLTRNGGVNAGKFNLLPSEVQSQGILELIENRGASTRNANTKEELSFIMQF
jgi:hypothetical protein